MGRKILMLVSLLLLLLAVLPSIPLQTIWAWQLTIVATEYGHWLAVLSFILWVLSLRIKHWHGGFLSFVTILLFLHPTFELNQNLPQWKAQLDEAFGIQSANVEELPSLGRLWNIFRRPPSNEQSFVYREDGTAKMELDFFRPQDNPSKKAPWVLVVPGGAWEMADRTQNWQMNSYLAQKGYGVAEMTYRHLPLSPWPIGREDVLKAIDYMKAHAFEFGIDPDNWVILGRSAGGQIAESIAYDDPPAGLKAGIFFYAPADLRFAYNHSSEDDMLKTKSLLRRYLALKDPAKAEDFDIASPIFKVNAHSMPTLLFHGMNDTLVWSLQSRRLHQKLVENGVVNTLIEIPWGAHGFDYNFSGPGSFISGYAIERFLAKETH